MNGIVRYLIPLAFVTLAIYYALHGNWLEVSLYVSVGIAFPLMWALKEGKIKNNLKIWNALAWGMVILALFLFFVLLRMDAMNAQ